MTREQQTKLEIEKGKMVQARTQMAPVFREHIKGSVAPNKQLVEWIALADEAEGK
jgi:hypothetical protein